jgi:hypothetical protein
MKTLRLTLLENYFTNLNVDFRSKIEAVHIRGTGIRLEWGGRS